MTTASKITLIRVALIPIFMTLFLMSNTVQWLRWLALGVFIVASLTDFVDGKIARRYHQESNFGKFLDPLADKLLVISAMTIFCQWNIFPAWALMIVLAREFAVTGLRLIAVGNGNVIAAGRSGKIKTACTMVGLCIMIPFYRYCWINWLVIIIIIATTIYSGFEYFVKNWNTLELKKKD